ncbi:MAG TPA: amino acid ABC transporter ATP-binding protein [Paraburkholderia sp.]|nr:amino acid ABC transporter ATP-binding protein [Paraburkholderia sp.]
MDSVASPPRPAAHAYAADAGATRKERPVIEISGLTKRFGQSLVLDSVDLSVQRGEVVAVLGRSGGGKSTMLRCINLLETPDSGVVRVADHVLFDGNKPASRSALIAARRDVGMLFQSFNVFPHLSAVENIALPLVRNAGMTREEAIDVAMHFLGKVGLYEKALHMPSQLSGGQLQRVALARALALNPKALLFDEPTSALDPESTNDVLAVMRDLSVEGMTMIVVTHEIRFALNVASTVVIMDGGRIVEKGDPKTIIESPSHERTRSFLAGH